MAEKGHLPRLSLKKADLVLNTSVKIKTGESSNSKFETLGKTAKVSEVSIGELLKR